MILLEDILKLHELSIERFGGSHGIREPGLLESAISRPFQTFDGNELYPSVIQKSSALVESLVKNHPFVDGNKRTGAIALVAFLEEEGFSFLADEESFYNLIISISTGERSFDEIVTWLKENTISQVAHI